MDLWGSSNLGGGGSSTATLPDQITNLVCVAGTDGTAGTIDVSFTEVPATSFGLLKHYILVYKAGGVPQSPFDGVRITLPKGTAGAKKTYKITGLIFDQMYGVRIYPVSTRNQYQTLVEGATATDTPTTGIINASSLSINNRIAIPANGDWIGNEVIWKIADKNHTGYPSGSVTLITDRIIALLPFDAKEPSNSNADRRQYGNNRYSYANLRQWLNSNAAAGAWYSSQHAADAPPNATNVSSNAYDGIAGFLAIFDPKFAAALLETTLTVARNTVTDGGSYETVTDKVFLASNTEVGLANENSIAEGVLLPLFSDNASRITQCTAAAITASNDGSKPANTSAAWYWWLRTPNSSNARYVRLVYMDGTLYSLIAYNGNRGVRPLCNIPSNFKLKAEPRSDGCYVPI